MFFNSTEEEEEENEELLRLTQHPAIGIVVSGVISGLSSIGTVARENDVRNALRSIAEIIANVGNPRRRMGLVLVAITNFLSDYGLPRRYLNIIMNTVLDAAPPSFKNVIFNIIELSRALSSEEGIDEDSTRTTRVTRTGFIDILPEPDKNKSSKCPICIDSCTSDIVCLPCEHVYHRDCIQPWIESHNTCPVCRYELPSSKSQMSRYERDRRKRMRLNFPRAREPEMDLEIPSAYKNWWGNEKNIRVCPSGMHDLVPFETPRDSFECDICSDMQPKGEHLRGCRVCDFDVCDYCFTQRLRFRADRECSLLLLQKQKITTSNNNNTK